MQLRGCGQGWDPPVLQQQARSRAVSLVLHVQPVVTQDRLSVIRIRSKWRIALCYASLLRALAHSGIGTHSCLLWFLAFTTITRSQCGSANRCAQNLERTPGSGSNVCIHAELKSTVVSLEAKGR